MSYAIFHSLLNYGSPFVCLFFMHSIFPIEMIMSIYSQLLSEGKIEDVEKIKFIFTMKKYIILAGILAGYTVFIDYYINTFIQ